LWKDDGYQTVVIHTQFSNLGGSSLLCDRKCLDVMTDSTSNWFLIKSGFVECIQVNKSE